MTTSFMEDRINKILADVERAQVETKFRPALYDEVQVARKILRRKKLPVTPKFILVRRHRDFVTVYFEVFGLTCIGMSKCSFKDTFRDMTGFAVAFRRGLEASQIQDNDIKSALQHMETIVATLHHTPEAP